MNQILVHSGSNSEYRILHRWVEKMLGTENKCENCGRTDSGTRYDWSNISGEYKKDVSDWERLCRSCHTQKDLRKDVCPKGHLLSGENLWIHPTRGHRVCRTCKNNQNKAYRARLKEKTL